MVSTVLSLKLERMVRCIKASVSESTAAVASSATSTCSSKKGNSGGAQETAAGGALHSASVPCTADIMTVQLGLLADGVLSMPAAPSPCQQHVF